MQISYEIKMMMIDIYQHKYFPQTRYTSH